MAKQRILIVEDDPTIRSFMAEYLLSNGYDIRTVAEGRAVIPSLKRESIDLLLLDLGLPDQDGFSIAEAVRKSSKVPIIIVTARFNKDDVVRGLELGADDYMIKPFEARELLARIRSVLRRSVVLEEAAPLSQDMPKKIVFGRYTLNTAKQVVMTDEGELIPLTALEFTALFTLLRNAEGVVSKEALFKTLHGRDCGPLERSLDVLMMRLRRKLKDDGGGKAPLIKTVRGAGYSFSVPVKVIGDRKEVKGQE